MARIGQVLVFALVLSFGLSQAGTTEAQGARTVVIGGLDSPRGLAFGPDGKLYVAEAGSGGDEQSAWVPPFQTAKIGTTGRILKIDGGESTVVASGIQSVALGPAAEVTGPNDLAFIGDTLYAVVGQANPLPTGSKTFSLLVKVGADGKAETVADLGKYELDNNPDGTVPDSNPFGLAVGPDGNLYVADAGGNDLLKVTPSGQISTAMAWKDNPVPTTVAFDKSGRAYAAFLSHAPFLVGSSRLERLTSGGSSEVLVPALTMVVDLEIGPDGMPYLLQHAAEFVTNPPPPKNLPNSGRVLRVGPNGLEEMVSGLNFPTKMTFGPDGSLYVSNNAVGAPKGGEILKLTLPASGTPVTIAPAAQPSPAAGASPAAKPSGPAPAASPAAAPAAKPAAPAQAPAAKPSPVASPAALPRTGFAPDVASAVAPFASAGVALTVVGLGLLRRRRR
jgi:sugar lactone lactonase YvrE